MKGGCMDYLLFTNDRSFLGHRDKAHSTRYSLLSKRISWLVIFHSLAIF